MDRQYLGKGVLNAFVVGAQRLEDVPEFPPAFMLVADSEMPLRVHARGDDDRDNDVAEVLALSASHRPPDCLHHVDGRFARLQERDSGQRRRVRALPEYPDVQDAVRLVGVRDGEAAFGLVTFGDRRGSVKVLKPVAGC